MKLKIKFTDFWADFNYTDNYFIDLLKNTFDIELSDKPDVLFYSFAGNENIKYMNCKRIFFTGENLRPDFTACDYAISYDFIDSDRHYRWPLYNLYGLDIPTHSNINRNKFCCMVVSNDSCAYRNVFFEELNKIQKVDSGGRYKNNIGGPIQDKLAFLEHYKFCLAFENSSYPGYTTEKILEAKKSGCIPIYWGNTEIYKDFNPDSFINLHNFVNWNVAIKTILNIHFDQKRYETMQKAPFLINSNYTNQENFTSWLSKCITQESTRDFIKIKKYKPSIDMFWIIKTFQYYLIDLLTRKIGLKRFFKIAIFKYH